MHSKSVYQYALYLAESLNLDPSKKRIIKFASLFHDIGKIAIKDKILFKPSSLDDNEYMEIIYHPLVGAEILSELENMSDIAEVVLQHHERPDGQGYPFGLSDDQIRIEAKIISIADVFDALISDRIYRKKLSLEETIQILEDGKGTQFDEKITETFIRGIDTNGAYPACR